MMRTIKMRLRFMKLLSWDRRLFWRYDCDIGTRRQTGPEQVECSLDARMQGGITMERPEQERAKDRLSKNVSDLPGGEVVADFAAFLPELNHLGMEGMDALLHLKHGFAHRSRREIGPQKGPDDLGVARGLLGHAHAKPTEEFGHGLVGAASSLNGSLQLAKLHLSKSQQDMVFAGEIVEKGALADVGSVGDIFHGGFRETLLGEEVEGGAKQPLADFRAAALSAADGGGWSRRVRAGVYSCFVSHNDQPSEMTVGHILTFVKHVYL